MEQRAEIETLHAEHDHATVVMQAESKSHMDTITLLQQELATTKAHAILPSVAQGLRQDISDHFHTITTLNKELAATKAEADGLMEALTQAKTDQTLSEQSSAKLRSDIRSLTDQLDQSQHDRHEAQRNVQDLQAQLQQLTPPPPHTRMPSQAAGLPSTNTPSQVQSLREELTSLTLQTQPHSAPLPSQSPGDQALCPWESPPGPSRTTSPLSPVEFAQTPVSSPTDDEPYIESWAETTNREAHLPLQEIPPTDQLPLPPQSAAAPTRATTTQEVSPLHQHNQSSVKVQREALAESSVVFGRVFR